MAEFKLESNGFRLKPFNGKFAVVTGKAESLKVYELENVPLGKRFFDTEAEAREAIWNDGFELNDDGTINMARRRDYKLM